MRIPVTAAVALSLLVICGLLVRSVSPVSAGVSLETLTVTDTIQTGGAPLLMAMTPDGQKLYVVKSAEEDPSRQDIAGSVLVIDPKTNTLLNEIPLSPGFPFGIAITADGSRAYLAVSKNAGLGGSSGANRVDVINTSSDTIANTVPIGGSPPGAVGIAITPDGSRIYVSHRTDNKVDVINAASNTVVDSVALGNGTEPIAIAITPDGSRAYVANRANGTVSVIDVVTNDITTTVSISLGASGPATSIQITPDGSRAYVAYRGSGFISVIDTDPTSTTFNEEIDLIPTDSDDLANLAVASDGSMVFVNGPDIDRVLIIDIDPSSSSFHTQIASVQVGREPIDVIFLQSLPVPIAYVSNFSGGSVSVIGFPPHVSGCIEFNGAPLVNRKVKLSQNDEETRSVKTDDEGCFMFENLIEDKKFKVLIKGPVVP